MITRLKITLVIKVATLWTYEPETKRVFCFLTVLQKLRRKKVPELFSGSNPASTKFVHGDRVGLSRPGGAVEALEPGAGAGLALAVEQGVALKVGLNEVNHVSDGSWHLEDVN